MNSTEEIIEIYREIKKRNKEDCDHLFDRLHELGHLYIESVEL